MLVIGLTAGIGSGKSVVGNWFRERGIPVIDADAIVRRLYAAGTEVTGKIAAEFGKDILNAQGEVDRRKLGERAFNDPGQLHSLNRIVHPEVRMEIERQLRKWKHENTPMVVVEVPLLLESRMEDLADKIVVVDVPEKRQLERIMQRDGIPAAEAEKRIAAQMTREEKKEKADYVIDNSQSLFSSKQQFDAIFEKLREETG